MSQAEQLLNEPFTDRKKVIIDKTGKIHFRAKELNSLHPFNKDGLAVFDNMSRRDESLPDFGLVDVNGKIAAQGTHFRNFSEGSSLVVEPRNRTTFADINGKVRISWPRAIPGVTLRQPLMSEGLTLVSIADYQTLGLPYEGGWIGGQRVAYAFMNTKGKIIEP